MNYTPTHAKEKNKSLLAVSDKSTSREFKRVKGKKRALKRVSTYTQTLLEPETILSTSLMQIVFSEIGELLKREKAFFVAQIHIENFNRLKEVCDTHLAELLQSQLSFYASELLSKSAQCLYAGDGGFYLLDDSMGLNDDLDEAISHLRNRLDMPFHTADETVQVNYKIVYLKIARSAYTPDEIIQSLAGMMSIDQPT